MIQDTYASSKDLQIVRIEVQIDDSEFVVKQVREILNRAVEKVGNKRNIDIIILPGYSPVAALLVLELVKSGHLPNILTMKKAGLGSYLPNHLIKGNLYAPDKSVEGKK